MKRLLKNNIYVVIIAAILLMAALSYEKPPLIITGDTPVEKAESLERAANSTGNNNFARVFFNGYDPEKKSWLYSIMMNEPGILIGGGDPAGQQAAQAKRQAFRDIVEKLFVETAKFDESAEEIVIKVIFPFATDKSGINHGFIYKAEKSVVEEIRKHPESWDYVVNFDDPEPFLGFYPSMNQQQVTEITGSTPLEKSESMVQYLNGLAINDFEKIFLDNYDSETGIWKYTVLVTDPSVFDFGPGSQDQLDKQFKLERHRENIKALFVHTAEWDETAKRIIVQEIFPISVDPSGVVYGFVYSANELGLTNLRKYPKSWTTYARPQDREKIFLVPQSVLGDFIEEGMPVEEEPEKNYEEEE